MMNFQEEAMKKLATTAPELASLVVSFRDLSEEIPEGNEVAVGAFILKAPSGFYFIPVVAKGNTVYPMDSLFDGQTKKFKPLSTAYIQRVLFAQGNLGSAEKMPKYVDVNPSLYHLIVPPRTGKYAYASDTLFTEFLAALPQHLKNDFSSKLHANKDMAMELSRVIDLKDIADVLAQTSKITPTVSGKVEGVQILTPVDSGKEKLEDAAIQDILNVGYHIRGDNETPRMAIPYRNSAENLIQLKGVQEGNAYFVHMKDGSKALAMVPLRVRASGAAELATERNVGVGYSVTSSLKPTVGDYLAITSSGDYLTVGEAVVEAVPHDTSEVVKDLYNESRIGHIGDIEIGDKFVVVTEDGVLGPFEARSASATNDMVSIRASDLSSSSSIQITASKAFKGKVYVDGRSVYVPHSALVIELERNVTPDVEVSINMAANRQELVTKGLLEDQIIIRNHGVGSYSINGHTTNGEAGLVRNLMLDIGMSKEACLSFVKMAKEDGYVRVLLSKKASDMGAIAPGEIPEYGQAVPEQPGLLDPTVVQQSVETRDPMAVEATIMSQFLQDPDMYETVSSYLPIIEEAVDKLGRTLLLLRINTDATQSEDIAALITSIRNTYKNLGDNALKIENLVSGAAGAR